MGWFLFHVSDRKYKPWRNAWTPFLRRFTDERARELAETKQLYEDVRARHGASQWADKEVIFRVTTSILHWAAVRSFKSVTADSTSEMETVACPSSLNRPASAALSA
jgi:hypothetical protein